MAMVMIVPMIMVIVVMMMRMVVMMIMTMLCVVVMRMIMRLCGFVGAAFRLERRFEPRHFCAEGDKQFLNRSIALRPDAVGQ